MTTIRRSYTPAFKAEIVRELLRERKVQTLAQSLQLAYPGRSAICKKGCFAL